MSTRRKNYSYTDAGSGSTGIMRCCVCSKPITTGLYRYHTGKNDGFVNCHRECCAEDAKWEQLDKAHAAGIDRLKRLVAACVAFRDEWGVTDLEPYLSEQPQ